MSEYLSKLHSEIITVMDEIDRICTKHHIKYYLCGGSLLGAIRHKGFIPWDDDLDIAMPRDDMNKFIEVCATELSEDYVLEWYGSQKGYYQYFPKVSKKNTLFEQRTVIDGVQSGIFVDIFPLDYSPAYSSQLEGTKNDVRRLARLICSRYISTKTPIYRIFKILTSIIPRSFFINLLNYKLDNLKKKGSTHYANFGSQYKLKKQTMPVEWYGEGASLQFEDREYMAPSEYLKVLKSIYGDNYMQLPPLEKRRCHYPSRVIFSDGEVMEFDQPEHIVTITEQEN